MGHNKCTQALIVSLPGSLASTYLAKLFLFQKVLPLESIFANFAKTGSKWSMLSGSGAELVIEIR